MLEQLPLEVLFQVVQYITLREFKKLSLCCRFLASRLPSRPKLCFDAYRKSVDELMQHCELKDYSILIELDSNSINAVSLQYLASLGHLSELKRILATKSIETVPKNVLQMIFEVLFEQATNPRPKTKVSTFFGDNMFTNPSPRLAFDRELTIRFLELGLDPSFGDDVVFQTACFHGQVDVVELLLADSRCNPGAQSSVSVSEAVKGGNLQIMKLLLQDPRVRPEEQDTQPLCLASGFGDIEMLKLLMADHRIRDQLYDHFEFGGYIEDPLSEACLSGAVDCVKFLLDYIDPSIDNNNAILHAISAANLDTLKLLLEHENFDPDLHPTSHSSILTAAVESGNVSTLELLLQDPRFDPTKDKFEALYAAFQLGHNEMIDILLNDCRVANSISIETRNNMKNRSDFNWDDLNFTLNSGKWKIN
jgi:ankyrin repeat protein